MKRQVVARILQAHRVASDLKHELKLVTLTYSKDVDKAFVLKSLAHLSQALRRRFQLFEYARFPERTQRGRIHLHLIVLCPYIPQEMLSRLWETYSHGAYIVDIRKVQNTRHLVNYVSKYVTKGPAAKITYSRKFPGKHNPPVKSYCNECAATHAFRRWNPAAAYEDGATFEHLYYGDPIYHGQACACWTAQPDNTWKRA